MTKERRGVMIIPAQSVNTTNRRRSNGATKEKPMEPTVDNKQELGQRAIDWFEYICKKLGQTRFIDEHTFTYDQDLENGAAIVIVRLGLPGEPGPYLQVIFQPRVLSEAELQQLGNRPRMLARSRWFLAEISGDCFMWDEHKGVWYERVSSFLGMGPNSSFYSPKNIIAIIRGTWRVGEPCAVCGGTLMDPAYPRKQVNDINLLNIPNCPHCKGNPDYTQLEWETR
jgi:hypothetical protein